MFDVTSISSVESVKRCYQAIQEMRKNDIKNPSIVFVGNKCDLKSEVPRDEFIKSFLKDGIPVKDLLFASAKENINVNETFYILLKRIYNTEKDFIVKGLYTPIYQIKCYLEFVDVTFEFSS